MKKYLLPFATIFSFLLFLGSCSNEDTEVSKSISDQEKLKEMTRLYEEYGWEKDSSVSDTERNKMLLEMDLETFKQFLEFFKSGGKSNKTFSPELKTDTTDPKFRSSREGLTYVIKGSHSSQVISSTTEMELSYNWPQSTECTVTNTKVFSNPSCTWSPDSYSTFKFDGNRCNVSATGTGKALGISRKMKMSGYVVKDSRTGYIQEGEIEHFREN